MKTVLHPWQMLLPILAGWINQQQQNAIEYLIAENRILREKIGKKRILLTDDERRRLAVEGKVLGRKALAEICCLFTPETILRWHRELIAKKWDYSKCRKKVGRPKIEKGVAELVVQMAKENPNWGYNRIQGALANLGYKISDTGIRKILKEHGIDPATERKKQTTWKAFLEAHWDVLAAVDFTTIEVWTKSGLQTFFLLFVMEIATRRVCSAGCTSNPDEDWMIQVIRTVIDWDEGFLKDKRYLLMDRNAKYSETFGFMLKGTDVEPVRLPQRSPNLNSHIERYMRSLKEECLERLILFGEKSLLKSVSEYLTHFHTERSHQGLENRIIQPGDEAGKAQGKIACDLYYFAAIPAQ
jgi:putative transposase